LFYLPSRRGVVSQYKPLQLRLVIIDRGKHGLMSAAAASLLLHHIDLPAGGIVGDFVAVGRFGNFAEITHRYQLVEVFGIASFLNVELLDDFVEGGDVDFL